MYKLLIFFFVISFSAFSQPHYTKLRAGFTFDALGMAPISMISAEVPFKYMGKEFWSGQFGLGLAGNVNSGINPSLGLSTSYNKLLNPYRKQACNPAPSYRRVEAYLELGLGLSIFDGKDNGLPPKLYHDSNIAPVGLGGIRMHFVSKQWIYLLKAKFTPILNSRFPGWGGISLGIGWR